MNSTLDKGQKSQVNSICLVYATEPELIAVSLFLVEFANATFFITIVLVFWIVTVEGCAYP